LAIFPVHVVELDLIFLRLIKRLDFESRRFCDGLSLPNDFDKTKSVQMPFIAARIADFELNARRRGVVIEQGAI
jgi:hypothetical protein